MAIIPKFDDVEVVLADSRGHVRSSLKTALSHAGFLHIRHTGAITNLTETVQNLLGPDILICDMGLEDGETRELIRSIRYNDLGRNPFLCVIGMTWEPTEDEVTRMINSGVDHLLRAPIAPDQILTRIRAMIRDRAPFVVTTDYIGPDRRKLEREASKIPVFEVPNTLRTKSTGPWNFADLESELRQAAGDLHSRRIDRQAENIMNLAGRIAEEAAKNGVEGLQPYVERLDRMVRTMRRGAEDRGLMHISELCQACVKVVDELWGDGGLNVQRDLELLKQLGRAIRTALFPQYKEAIAHDIATIVASAR